MSRSEGSLLSLSLHAVVFKNLLACHYLLPAPIVRSASESSKNGMVIDAIFRQKKLLIHAIHA